MSLFDGEDYKRTLYAYASPAADQNKVWELVESFRQIEARNAKIELHFTTLCPPHMVYIVRRRLDVGESPVPERP